MADEGLLQHEHNLTWIGFTSLQGTPVSKFTCDVDSCPYNPASDDVAASQAMQIIESVSRRVARNIYLNGPYLAVGVCVFCGEAGTSESLAVLGNHLTTCSYRLSAYIASGALVDTAGSTSSGIVADVVA